MRTEDREYVDVEFVEQGTSVICKHTVAATLTAVMEKHFREDLLN